MKVWQLSNWEYSGLLPLHKVLDCSSLDKPLLGTAFYFLRGFICSGTESQGITGSKTNGSFPSNMAVKILSEKCYVVLQKQVQALMSVDKLMTAAYQLIN